MLVLSRYEDESVIIILPGGRRCKVQVAQIRRDKKGKQKVRLGFEFPRDVPVHREEVQEQIDRKAVQS